MRYAALIFFALFLWSFPAFSQGMALPLNTAPTEKNEYKDVKDEYIEEAQQFFARCSGDYTLSQYYDCECLSVRYLDARIAAGPSKNDNELLLTIKDKCLDGTMAAGEMYNSCITNGTIFPQGQDPEDYCACISNTYAKLFEKSGRAPSSRGAVELQSRAHMVCRYRNEPPN